MPYLGVLFQLTLSDFTKYSMSPHMACLQ